jgi:hypothetical protein
MCGKRNMDENKDPNAFIFKMIPDGIEGLPDGLLPELAEAIGHIMEQGRLCAECPDSFTCPKSPEFGKTPEEVEKEEAIKRAELRERMLAAERSLSEKCDYLAGDLVVWKDGMRNRGFAACGEPMLCAEILKKPVEDQHSDSKTPWFHEPLNVRVGVIDGEGDYLCYFVDGRRLRKL